ncbi:MAG TPA: hypothetical protein VNJ08_16315 [Bacteriovoracaceae bacterium]|nr:hypothetical protein [Bacteriovoracaceae bacterium]
MINKIKDFVKIKLLRRKHNQSDQDAEDDSKLMDQIPPDENSFHHDTTGNFKVPETMEEEAKPNWRERISLALASIKSKYDGRRLKPLTVASSNKDSKTSKLALLSPSVGKNIEKVLSRSSREPIHQAFLVLMICAVTYTMGKISALGLRGTPTFDSAKDYAVVIPFERDFNPNTLSQVKSINIFRTNTGLGKKNKLADTKCEESQGVSNLPIKLVNTTVLQDTIKSMASVQVRSDRLLQEVREGEQIANLAKIFKIERLELLVKNLESGACESIISSKLQDKNKSPINVMSASESREFLKNKKLPGIENDGNKFKISKALLDDKMKDIASILTQARAIKIQNPDGSIAFKLTEMDPAGIFPYLGLQDQDIITAINGKQIYDMNEVMSLFARIKNLDKLSLGVKREGSDSVQEYSIKK